MNTKFAPNLNTQEEERAKPEAEGYLSKTAKNPALEICSVFFDMRCNVSALNPLKSPIPEASSSRHLRVWGSTGKKCAEITPFPLAAQASLLIPRVRKQVKEKLEEEKVDPPKCV